MASGVLKAGKYATSAAGVPRSLLVEPLLPNSASKRTTFTDDDSDASSLSWDDPEASARSLADGRRGLTSLTAKDAGAFLLVAGGLAASAAVMVAAPSALVLLMGGICAPNAMGVAYKQVQIAANKGVRDIVNGIRKDIELLKEDLDILSMTVDELQAEADVLRDVEEDLRGIADEQGMNVNRIVDLVNENEEILSKMKHNLKESFVAGLAKVIMRSDKDGDMTIDEEELPILIIRLQLQLEPFGIRLDTEVFKAMMRENNDISVVMKFCGDMLFEGENDDAEDKDDGDASDDETLDFEAFCKTLGDDGSGELTYEEKVNMVVIDEKFAKGSVERARGQRMTMMPSKNTKQANRKTVVDKAKRRQTKLMVNKKNLAKPMLAKRNTCAEF